MRTNRSENVVGDPTLRPQQMRVRDRDHPKTLFTSIGWTLSYAKYPVWVVDLSSNNSAEETIVGVDFMSEVAQGEYRRELSAHILNDRGGGQGMDDHICGYPDLLRRPRVVLRTPAAHLL
jgi:hypothetical protein